MGARFSSGINPDRLKAAGEDVKPQRNGKYNAHRTEYNGVRYASKLEADTARHLDLLKKGGYVTGWEAQVPFQLHAGIVYRADFVIQYKKGKPRALDSKGMQTPEFKLKRRLFEDLYGPLDVIGRADEVPLEGHP